MREHLWVYVREERGKLPSGLLARGCNTVRFRCDRCEREVAVQRDGGLPKSLRRREPSRQELVEACKDLLYKADEFKDCDLLVVGDVLDT